MSSKVFVIAEAGVNHNGSIKNALELVEIAKDSGADAVKFQLFDKFEQISKKAPTAPYQNQTTKKNNMLEMAKDYDLSWERHIEISKFCKKNQIEYMASVFDKNSLDFYLKKIKAKTIKIASSEIDNFKLLNYVNLHAKNVIISTGMANIIEIDNAIRLLSNVKNLSILQCTSCYPTNYDDVNLSFINLLKKKYQKKVGFSDHTLDDISSIVAVGMGVDIIEKHFTINNKLKGPDHLMSLDPKGLKNFIKKIRIAESVLGSNLKKPTKSEIKLLKFSRRGLVASCNLKKGQIIKKSHINFKRPAVNFMIKDLKKILGKKINKNIKIDEIFNKKTFK